MIDDAVRQILLDKLAEYLKPRLKIEVLPKADELPALLEATTDISHKTALQLLQQTYDTVRVPRDYFLQLEATLENYQPKLPGKVWGALGGEPSTLKKDFSDALKSAQTEQGKKCFAAVHVEGINLVQPRFLSLCEQVLRKEIECAYLDRRWELNPDHLNYTHLDRPDIYAMAVTRYFQSAPPCDLVMSMMELQLSAHRTAYEFTQKSKFKNDRDLYNLAYVKALQEEELKFLNTFKPEAYQLTADRKAPPMIVELLKLEGLSELFKEAFKAKFSLHHTTQNGKQNRKKGKQPQAEAEQQPVRFLMN